MYVYVQCIYDDLNIYSPYKSFKLSSGTENSLLSSKALMSPIICVCLRSGLLVPETKKEMGLKNSTHSYEVTSQALVVEEFDTLSSYN